MMKNDRVVTEKIRENTNTCASSARSMTVHGSVEGKIQGSEDRLSGRPRTTKRVFGRHTRYDKNILEKIGAHVA
jgi:hypothetical protein